MFLGLSMFGIVGALTVFILCLFSAAAVIARVSSYCGFVTIIIVIISSIPPVSSINNCSPIV